MVAFTPAGTCAAVHPSVGWPSLTPVHEVGPARKTRVPSVITKPAMQVTPAIVTVTPGWTVARAADAPRGPAVAPGAPPSAARPSPQARRQAWRRRRRPPRMPPQLLVPTPASRTLLAAVTGITLLH